MSSTLILRSVADSHICAEMQIIDQKMENLKAENHKLKREMKAWIDDNGQ